MKKIDNKTGQDKLLEFIYGHTVTRMLLRPFISPKFSLLGGKVLDSRLSCIAIKPFIKKNHIDMDEFEPVLYNSYNEFFKRKIADGKRPYSNNEEDFISPCDSRLSVYKINGNAHFVVKNTPYTVKSLLRSGKLADEYEGGYIWVFRLCVDDYHRYIYPVSGRKSKNRKIAGVFHTVNPIANDYFPIYKENTREYCVIRNNIFDNVVMMEVGAMLVGKIENHHHKSSVVKRGEEKGNFAFGGSTIILITKKDTVRPNKVIIKNSMNNIETRVMQGETVGSRR
ncbi:MAG: phosphatidylserine decarboxylase [Coprococcus sp.]